MQLTLATYNVNNLFRRPAVMELEGFSPVARAVLNDVATLNDLLARDSYAGIENKLLELLTQYDQHLNRRTKNNQWFSIVNARGKLLGVEKATRKPVLRAAGRADWFGWVELSRAEVDGVTTGHTAEVIREVDADVLCLVEVEDRTTLERFNTQALEPLGVDYPHSLLVDGNDPRGIDIGLYSRFPVRSVLPHIDDVYTGADGRPYRVFSRDCPEFEIVIPGKRRLWVLGNHLKSQGYGSKAGNDRKRRLQSDRVVAILKRYKLKRDWVVVAGDLNDFPDSKPLEPLTQHPDLHDVLKTPHWTGPDWTYHSGKKRLDYLFVSTALRSKLKAAGINRRGIFQRSSASNPEPCLPTITSTANQASDHAAVWAEFTI